MIFFSNGTFPLWPCKFVYPNFWQYQSDRNRDIFNCWFEIQSKTAQSNLCLCPKSFKNTLKTNSYLMSVCRCDQVSPRSYIFGSIDVTQTMAYWCSQKVVAYFENVIRNLERVFKLFWNIIWSLCGWFICFFLSILTNPDRNSLNF